MIDLVPIWLLIPTYRVIPLTKGKFAIVDADDYEYLIKFKWHINSCDYALGKDKVFMHRVVNKTPKNLVTDHINHNTLDNRKVNLRSCTNRQNSQNRRKVLVKSSTYKGVNIVFSYDYPSWHAHITVNGEKISLGYFNIEEAAATAYNEAAKKYFGEFACLNACVPTEDYVTGYLTEN